MRTNPNCSNYAMHPADMMTFPFTGTAGYMTWYGYKEPNYATLWPPIIRTQYHINGTDVINTLSEGGGSWGHGMQEARVKKSVSSSRDNLVETQYYGGYHADLTIGYVKNRTYNIKTNNCITDALNDHSGYLSPKSISSNKIRVGDTISIISLKNLTHYYIDWYSFNTGSYIKTDYKKTNFIGTLKLDFPTLTPNKDGNPVVWFVVHQYAYSGLMQTEAPMAERETTLFEFQSTENDATSSDFRNSIYPNPFKNEIIVNSLDDDILIIKALDGKVIYRQSVMLGKNNIILENLSNGLYLGELERQRFITKLEKR